MFFTFSVSVRASVSLDVSRLQLDMYRSRMVRLPIKLDSSVYLQDKSESRTEVSLLTVEHTKKDYSFVDSNGKRIEINGYDSSSENNGSGLRVTNLVGTRLLSIQKKCPNCHRVHPFEKYGKRTYKGRKMDQSNCVNCRSRY